MAKARSAIGKKGGGSAPDPPTFEQAWTDLAIAFGQGTGVIPVAFGVMAVALDRYERKIRRRLEVWHEHRSYGIEMARTLGRLAARYATSDGSSEIRRSHFNAAARKIQRRASLIGGVEGFNGILGPTLLC